MASEYKIAIHIAGKLESSLNSAVSSANKQLGLLGKSGNAVLSGIGKTAEAFGKATVAGFAATATAMAAGAKYAVDVGKDFESAMSSAAATAGVDRNSEAFAKMEEAAREAGATTSKTASEAANALEYMALAGWDVDTATSKLPDILHLSEATGLDLATTSDLVTDSLSAMGVGVDQLSDYMDVLAKAQNSSNMNVQQEMDAFIKSGGILQSLGVGYEDAATTLGLMANNGLKGAEAGTALNAIMRNLTKPSGESADAMEALGLSMFDAQGEFVGMENGLQQIHDKLAGMSSEDQTKYLNQLGGRYGSVLGLLLGNFEDIEDAQGNVTNGWKKLSGEIENSEGAMENMRNTKMDNLAGDIDIITSAVQDLGIEFYQAFSPEIRGLVQGVTAQVGELKEAFQDGGWEGFSEELGQSLADAAIELGNKAPEIIDQVGILANSVVGAFGKEENADEIGKAAVGILESLSSNLLHFGGTLGNTALSVIDSFVTAFAEDDAITKITSASQDMIKSLTQGFEEHGPDIADGVSTIIVQMAQAIPDLAGDLAIMAGVILLELSNGFAEHAGELGEAAGQLITDLAVGFVQHLPEIIQVGVTIVGGILVGLFRAAGALIAAVPGLFNEVGDAILSIDWLDVGINIVSQIWEGVQSLWESFIGWLSDLSAATEPKTDNHGQTLADGWHFEEHSGMYYNDDQANALYDQEGARNAGAFDVDPEAVSNPIDEASRKAHEKAMEGKEQLQNDYKDTASALDKALENLLGTDSTFDASALGLNVDESDVSGVSTGLEAAQKVIDEYANNVTGSASTIEENNDKINKSLQQLGANTPGSGQTYSSDFVNSSQDAVAATQQVNDDIIEQFSNLQEEMVSVGKSVGEGIAEGIESSQDQVTSAVDSMVESISTSLSAMTGAQASAPDTGPAPSPSASTQAPAAAPAIPTDGASFTIKPEFELPDLSVFDAFVQQAQASFTIKPEFELPDPSVFDAFAQQTQASFTIKPEFELPDPSVFDAFAQQTQASLSVISANATSVVSTTNGEISALFIALTAIAAVSGVTAGTGFTVSFAASMQGAIGAAQATSAGIVAQFNGLAVQMTTVGSQIGQGLVNGMQSMQGAVASAAASLASAATAAVQAAAQVHSPSAITTWIGENIGEGLVGGMESSAPRVSAAASGLGDAATNRSAIMHGITVDRGAGSSATITWAPVINITGSDIKKEDVNKALKLSMDEFDRYMKRWQKQRGRVAFA